MLAFVGWIIGGGKHVAGVQVGVARKSKTSRFAGDYLTKVEEASLSSFLGKELARLGRD